MFRFPNNHDKESSFARIRRLKKWLRPLPRRATIHRYPGLKWFAETARKRSYLWSFRRSEMISAIYVGSILTMLPLYGVQLGLAFIASLVFRANLMIAVALQFVSNPFTIPFLYWLEYKTGDFVLTTFGFSFHEDVIPYFSEVAEEEAIAVVTEGGTRPRWGYWIFATMIGGFVLGLGLAVILSLTYQLILSKTRLFANRANADDIHQPNRNKHGSSTP